VIYNRASLLKSLNFNHQFVSGKTTKGQRIAKVLQGEVVEFCHCRWRQVLGVLCLLFFLDRTATAADLMSIYHQALENDSVYASAKFAKQAGEEKEPQGLAGILPVVNFSANTTATNADVTYRSPTLFPSGNRFFNTSGYSVSLTQPLFRWQNWEAYQQGKLLGVQAEATFAQAGQDLIVRTAQAYFDVLAAQDVLDVARAQRAALEEQYLQAKRSFDLGVATITDSNEAKSRFDLAVSAVIAAEGDLAVKRTTLKQIIGRKPDVLAALRPGIALPSPMPEKLEDWTDAAEGGNYAVKALDAGAEAARRNVNASVAGHLPTVDLVASRSLVSATGGTTITVGSDIHQTVAGIQVAIPIFSGGGTSSKVREARAQYEKAKADLDTQKRSAVQAASEGFIGMTTALSQVSAYEVAVASSAVSVDSNKKSAALGLRVTVDVLNAEQQLYQAKQNLAKARYDVIVNSFKLKAAAGILGEEDVKAVNGMLAN
jgi:outer membrane protein